MLKELLTAPTEELGKWSRFAVFQLRLGRQCVRLLKQNRSGQQAAALSYHTIFGIVPLAIVMLMVFQLFPAYRDIGYNVKNFLYKQLLLDFEYPTGAADSEETPEAASTIKPADKIEELAERFLAKHTKGSITLFSGILVIWAAVGLLATIERAFNNIWHVGRGRNFVHRIINYWALLTLGPLLLGVGIYASTHYLATDGFQTGIVSYLRPLFPYAISVVAMFFLYFVMPNTKVSAKAALWGAMAAALLWTGARTLFAVYVTRFIPFEKVYGIMGLIPLSVLWIFITWWIVLFGLQLTFATQHLKTLDTAEIEAMNKRQEYFIANDFTIIKILGCILKAFDDRQGPVPLEVICSKLNLPADFAEKILEHLVTQGLLFRTTEPRTGFAPATEGHNITLAEIVDAAKKAGFAQGDEETPPALKAVFDAQNKKLAEYTLNEVLKEGHFHNDIPRG